LNTDTEAGATACAAETNPASGGDNSSGNEQQHYLSLAIGLSIGVVVVITMALGAWVLNQRKRRRAAMVDPNFPGGTGAAVWMGTADQHGIELGGRSQSMVLADNALSPARIIEAEFHNHDKDGDGHIDLRELTNLVIEVMATRATSTPPETHRLKCADISRIILRSVDDDGNDMLEKTEFTMLCLRVMRMAGRDDEVERLRRMVRGASDEDIATLKLFFDTMNSWFLGKMETLRERFPSAPDSPSGVYESPRVIESRPAAETV
jgi:hypothetical protein